VWSKGDSSKSEGAYLFIRGGRAPLEYSRCQIFRAVPDLFHCESFAYAPPNNGGSDSFRKTQRNTVDHKHCSTTKTRRNMSSCIDAANKKIQKKETVEEARQLPETCKTYEHSYKIQQLITVSQGSRLRLPSSFGASSRGTGRVKPAIDRKAWTLQVIDRADDAFLMRQKLGQHDESEILRRASLGH